MSKTRPKVRWWNSGTYGGLGAFDRRINRKGQRRVLDRDEAREVREQTE